MPENPGGQFDALFSEISAAMRLAKLMVWAGDYQRAAELLDRVGSHHSEELQQAERVGRSLLKARRDPRLRQELRREIEREARGKNLKLLLLDKMATLAAAETRYPDEEFAAATLALAYSNLRRRVFESGETEITYASRRRAGGKSPAELPALAEHDDRTGFRYLELRKDPGRIEMRAYRPDRHDIPPSLFVGRLREFWASARLIVEPESQIGEGRWPIWFRAFAPNLVAEGFLADSNVAWFECIFGEIERARETCRGVLGLLVPDG